MTDSLLDRQASLLEFLTSSAGIFFDGSARELGGPLRGMDGGLLCLEAYFSHEKRMAKIAAILPKTLAALGEEAPAVTRAFVEACPPRHIGRLETACEFYEFLCDPGGWWAPYLRDVAACELACGQVRAGRGADRQEGRGALAVLVRRSRCAVLLRCSYDIRSVIESGRNGSTPRKRDMALGVARLRDAPEAQVLELDPDLFAWLSTLDDWTDSGGLAAPVGGDALLEELVVSGLIEVRP